MFLEDPEREKQTIQVLVEVRFIVLRSVHISISRHLAINRYDTSFHRDTVNGAMRREVRAASR